jgi:hypothetical protein
MRAQNVFYGTPHIAKGVDCAHLLLLSTSNLCLVQVQYIQKQGAGGLVNQKEGHRIMPEHRMQLPGTMAV